MFRVKLREVIYTPVNPSLLWGLRGSKLHGPANIVLRPVDQTRRVISDMLLGSFRQENVPLMIYTVSHPLELVRTASLKRF